LTISAFDHPILSALVGDDEIALAFSVEREIKAMLAFEAALAEAEASHGLISAEAAARIASVAADFSPDLDVLAKGAAQDGVVVPALVKLLRAAVGDPYAAQVHRGATSQDVVDTSLVIRLKSVVGVLDHRLGALVSALRALERVDGDVPLMGRTRMQRALPIHARNKIEGWLRPIERHLERLGALRPRLLVVQFGGAVGARDGLNGKGEAIAAELAQRLDLHDGPCWHVERDGLAEFASWLSLVSGALGKLGQDVALLAQNEIGEVKLAGGGGSSAMPHKSNPVRAEVLVALARHNAGLLGAVHQALVHENERSGAAWTLEWLTLPPMAAATGAGLRQAIALVEGMRFVAAKFEG
jgi:3-carboxy-cis,cis-muconate cycloisomerase